MIAADTSTLHVCVCVCVCVFVCACACVRARAHCRYIFQPEDYPVIKELFEKESFVSAAQRVCPPDQQTLDPFQFNLIVQVPGQTVPLHLDAPYFWGASRFEFPQWLLATMVFSGLFQDRFIHQVQVCT
jgi:hypothetical protein